MFTGIIKALGKIQEIEQDGSNYHFTIQSPISKELKIDESIAHNGVCLTVVSQEADKHVVTAILETLERSNLGKLSVNDTINLERAMLANARLDGHIVQGHVDTTAECISVKEADGSWYYSFRYTPTDELLLVDKGSICVNGVSLTVVNPVEDTFSVAIIPFTYEHTSFKMLKVGDTVNLEFDILGKYIAKYAKVYMKS